MIRHPMRAEGPHASRRSLFGVAGATLLLSAAEAGATKAAELDGELLACCSRADVLDARSDALVAGRPYALSCPYWDEAERLSAEACALRVHAIGLPARTPEGLQAKARIVLSKLEDDGLAAEIALSLARDVLGRP